MTAEIIFSSNKLGNINHTQLQLMLDKFELGKLISSKRTEKGAMGQTMFISSSKGKFVFKGNPLYQGQFEEEKYFVENLHHKTSVKLPSPYLVDEEEDIFGWTYALMPCLAGQHMNSEPFKTMQGEEDRYEIAEAVARVLSEFHNWKVDQFGELDTLDFSIRPFEGSYRSWLFKRIRYWLDDAKKYSVITQEDITWVEDLLGSSKESLDHFSSPTFVMGDFKPENFLLEKGVHGWELGVFDFTNAYFGDPLSDLIKMITMYINDGEEEMAKHLVTTYLDGKNDLENYKQRVKVHMLHQRILDWGCAKAMRMVTWDDNLPFSKWVEKYTETAAALID